MLYSNPEFLIMTLLALVLYALSPTHWARYCVLTLCGVVFYFWAGIADLIIFVGVVLVSWLAVYFGARCPGQRATIVSVAVVLLVANLFYFKYASWVFRESEPWFGPAPEWSIAVRLPLGISFFTLQAIAYLIDYRRGAAPQVGFRDFFLFKSFFPQIIAGPIVRSGELLPQVQRLQALQSSNLFRGMMLFALGFFKKVLIADNISVFVDEVFATPGAFPRATVLLGVVGYACQIWGDFSGYTDMGRGVARMFGISLPENFFSPYLSVSPSDFLRRWHATLGSWIRDYLYIPLCGTNRGSSPDVLARLILATLLTMVLSGLWHGANWNFVIWGLYLGGTLVIERLLKVAFGRATWLKGLMAKPLLVFQCWLFVILPAAALFRADSLESVRDIVSSIWTGGLAGEPTQSGALVLPCLVVVMLVQWLEHEAVPGKGGASWERLGLKRRFAELSSPARAAFLGWVLGGLTALLLVGIIVIRIVPETPSFIYFQF